MKFLENPFLSFENDEKNRFIFNENSEVGNEGEEAENSLDSNSILSGKKRTELTSDEEILDELVDILENPIKFSFRDIRFLEKNISFVERDKVLKKKLQDLMVYYLSFSQSEILKKMPPRILYEMADSRRIRKFLPLRLLKSLDDVISRDIDKLKEFSKKEVEHWSTYETAQVCSLYRHLRKKSTLSDKLTPLFDSITKGLAKKAINFSVRNSTGNVVSIKGNDSISTSEKLLLWEIRKILPPSVWVDMGLSDQLTLFGKNEANELLDDILSDKTETKNNADLILLWDILEDLGSDPDSFFQLTADKQRTLRSFVLRGNAAQFLSGIDDQSILSPLHLKALAELRGNKELQEAIKGKEEFSKEWLDQWEKKDKEDFKKYEKEISDLRNEQDKIKEVGIDKALDSSEITKEKKNKYNDAKELFDEKWKELFVPIFEKIKGEFKESPNFKFIFHSHFKDFDSTENKSKKLEVARSICSELNQIVTSEKEGQKEARNFLQKDENINLVSEFDDLLKKTVEAHEIFKNEEKDLIDSVSNETNAEMEKIRKKKNEIEARYATKDVEDAFLKKVIKNFSKTEEQATKADERYWTHLNFRLENHRLHASDMEVILHLKDSDSLVGSLGDEKTKLEKTIEEDSQFDDFRSKFETVLNEQLEQINFDVSVLDDSIIGNAEDRFAPWISEVDRFLGVGELLKAMKERGFNFENQNPQIISELIEGAINFNKGHILEVLETKLEDASILDNDVRQNFLNKLRIHHKITTPQEIQSVDSAYERYFNTRQAEASEIQKERNKFDGILSSVFGENISELLEAILKKDLSRQEREWISRSLVNDETNEGEDENAFFMRILEPHLDLDLTEEVQGKVFKHLKILRAFHKNQEWLREGVGVFPGTEKLNEARLQMEPIRNEVQKVMRVFYDDVTDLQDLCTSEEDSDVQFSKFFKTWKEETKPDLERFIACVKSECELIFGASPFFETYFNNLNDALKTVDEIVLKIESDKKSGYQFLGTESEFGILKKGRDFFDQYLNFRDGFWAMEEAQRKKEFKFQEKSVNTLRSFGLFEDEYEAGKLVKKGSDKATEKFKSLQAEYGEKYNKFCKNIGSVKKIVEGDIAKYDDDYFMQKYHMTKEDLKKVLKSYDENLENFESLWHQFHGNPQFFTEWLERYGKDEKSRAEAINEFTDWETTVKQVGEITEKSKEMKDWLEANLDWKKANGFFGRGGQLGTGYELTFQNFSIIDVYRIFEKMVEHIEVYQKRKSDKAVSAIGQEIFGDTIWGKEFRRMGEDSESQRIKEFEDNYDDLDAWDIRKYMYNSSDPDEVRACIKLLKSRGFFKWDDPQFWMVLERLGGNEKFNYKQDMELDPMELQEKIRRSCERVWSTEVYRQWETSYEEDLNKAKSGWTREFNNLEHNTGERIKVLSTMLQGWKNGEIKDIDPSRYEEYVFAAMDGGKMNGPSDKRWYFLIQGIATKNSQGQSLISRDALNRISDKYLAEMPYLEFFTDESSWKLNGEIVPEDTPGASQRPWKYKDYLAWGDFLGDSNGTYDPRLDQAKKNTKDFFYHYIIQSDMAMDRAGRMQRAGGKNADHDDGAAYMAAWTDGEVSKSLSSRSEGTQQYTNDFWRNFIQGFDIYAHEMKEYIDKGDKKYGEDPNWEKRKQKTLKKVGAQLRTAIRTTQILQGNLPSSRQEPLVFDKDDWEKDTDYSQNGFKSQKRINSFMKGVLTKHGALEKHGGVLDYMGVNISKSQDERKKDNVWIKKNESVTSMLSENESGKFFSNTAVIWEVLKEHCKNTKSLDEAEDEADNSSFDIAI